MAGEEDAVQDLILMLNRATDSSTDESNEFAVDMFCAIIQKHPELIKKSTDLLLEKIKSSNINQSRKGLDTLYECMAKGGPIFQTEISKFRFLNELIRLVSKKYLADKTPPEIRYKIMDYLLLWTIQYPDKTKIKDAYEILRKEGVEHAVTPSVCHSEKRNVIFEPHEEDLFKKLLHSKNPDDILKANLLIKRKFCQDAKKNDLRCRQKTELSEAQNTVSLFDQVINSWVEDDQPNESEETITLMKDLYDNCKSFCKSVCRISETVEDDEDLLREAIEASEALTDVMEKYKSVDGLKRNQMKTQNNVVPSSYTCSDLLSTADEVDKDGPSLEQELTEVFKANLPAGLPALELNADLLSSTDILEPIPIEKNSIEVNLFENGSCNSKNNVSPLSDINRISEELLKQNLDSTKHFVTFKKEPSKVPLNQLIKNAQPDKVLKKHEDSILANGFMNELKMASVSASFEVTQDGASKEQSSYSIDEILDKVHSMSNMRKDVSKSSTDEIVLDTMKKPMQATACSMESDFSDLLMSGDEKLLDITSSPENRSYKEIKPVTLKMEVPLSGIFMDLGSVKPSKTPPMIIKDDPQGLRIVLNFALDRPSPNVIVIVITTTNQSLTSVDDFEIEACVPKPCKVRLLPCDRKSLPGAEPFQPPTENIKRILLLHNSTNKSVDITFIIGYKMADDPDPVREPVIARNIPYL